jgi:ABC-type cobalamin/Fe3+-siderophores transport system ATPase subunit
VYIARVVVQDFRTFRGQQEFLFAPGLNCLVGDNNCGKTTIFEALTYLLGVGRAPSTLANHRATDPPRVEADVAGGDVRAVVAATKYAKLRPFVFEGSCGPTLRFERNQAERSVTQGGKEKTLDDRVIAVWNERSAQFENPTGIDAVIRGLIDLVPVWADTDPADVADFGTTKILGKIIDSQVRRFRDTEAWRKFVEAHQHAFSGGEESLASLVSSLADDISSVVNEQYGRAKVRFGFEAPEPASLVKSGQLYVDDGAGETSLSMKGTGMQRAFALALIQVLSRTDSTPTTSEVPLVLLIDEPETWLHPMAQLRLGQALATLAESQQTFLITHSPYLLRQFSSERHQLVVFGNWLDERPRASYQQQLGLTTAGEPSWGEVNFRAFGVVTDEFLDELYALVTMTVREQAEDPTKVKDRDVHSFLARQGLPQDWKWQRDDGSQPQPITRAGYVRHSIHHPENTQNARPTDADRHGAVEDLLRVVGGL